MAGDSAERAADISAAPSSCATPANRFSKAMIGRGVGASSPGLTPLERDLGRLVTRRPPRRTGTAFPRRKANFSDRP